MMNFEMEMSLSLLIWSNLFGITTKSTWMWPISEEFVYGDDNS